MKNKGLCITCVNDKGCTLSRKFPVLQCEEFTNLRIQTIKGKKKEKKQKQKIKYSKKDLSNNRLKIRRMKKKGKIQFSK